MVGWRDDEIVRWWYGGMVRLRDSGIVVWKDGEMVV